jgi:hypothetical protein
VSSVLIACGWHKLDRAAPAKDIYIGSQFKFARSAAESTGLPWFIMSAKHGILPPNKIIEPYDATYGRDSGMHPREIREQARVMNLPLPVWGFVSEKYIEILRLALGGRNVRAPFLNRRIGYQRQIFSFIRKSESIEEALRKANVSGF